MVNLSEAVQGYKSPEYLEKYQLVAIFEVSKLGCTILTLFSNRTIIKSIRHSSHTKSI